MMPRSKPKFRGYWFIISIAFGMCTTFFYNTIWVGFLTVLFVSGAVETFVEGEL